MAVRFTNEFGKALCEHFNLPADKVLSDIHVNTGLDCIFSVTLSIALTPDDLDGIAKLMARCAGGITHKTLIVNWEFEDLINKAVRKSNEEMIDRLKREGRI